MGIRRVFEHKGAGLGLVGIQAEKEDRCWVFTFKLGDCEVFISIDRLSGQDDGELVWEGANDFARKIVI